ADAIAGLARARRFDHLAICSPTRAHRKALSEQPRRIATENLRLLLRRQTERLDIGGVRDDERIVGPEQEAVLADLADRHLDERFRERASVVIEVPPREHAWRLR